MDRDTEETPSTKVLQDLAKALELPGQPQDYHSTIMNASSLLARRARREPDLLEEIERLYWLDIRLIEACPEAVTIEGTEPVHGRRYYEVPAFRSLALMYMKEGAIREALDVARRAARFGQQQELLEELEARIAVLESEDVV